MNTHVAKVADTVEDETGKHIGGSGKEERDGGVVPEGREDCREKVA
jgi:hypothetical protein